MSIVFGRMASSTYTNEDWTLKKSIDLPVPDPIFNNYHLPPFILTKKSSIVTSNYYKPGTVERKQILQILR